MSSPNKKIVLINRDFQFRYTRASVAVGIVSTCLTTLVILYPLYVFKILVVPQFLPWPILAAMIAAAFINIGMLIVFGVVLSHRVAGPLFNLLRQLRRIGLGQFKTEMRVRDGDDLVFVARNVNELSQSLVRLTQQDISFCNQILEENGLSKKGRDAIQDHISTLQKRCD
jgi:hypothetical protein